MKSSTNATGPVALIADDDAVCLQYCADTLASGGFRVHKARDGLSAMRLAGRIRPDLVLLDLHLPDLSACDVLRGVCAAWPDAGKRCRFLVMTADDSRKVSRALFRAGFFSVLAKPFRTQSLLREAGAVHAPDQRPGKTGGPAQSERLRLLFLSRLPSHLDALDHAISTLDKKQCASLLHLTCGSAALAGFADLAALGHTLAGHVGRFASVRDISDSYMDFLTHAADLLHRAPDFTPHE